MSRLVHRLPAVDALARGITNLRANAELLLVQLITTLFLAASFAVPFLLLLRKIGLPPSILFVNDPQKVQEAIAGIDLDPTAVLGAIGVGLLLFFVGGTVLFVVYCFAQGGTLAVLSTADAQAPATRGLPVEVFRTFSWRGFVSWALRYGWRLFWLNNLYLTLLTLALALFLVPALLVSGSFDLENPGPACLLFCGFAIPIFFLCFVLWLALQVSSAALVVDELGVVRAFRRGLAITGRRFGGLLLLFLVYMAAAMAVGMLLLVPKLAVTFALPEPTALRFGLSAGLEILSFLLSTSLALIFQSALIALVRGESRQDAGARSGRA